MNRYKIITLAFVVLLLSGAVGAVVVNIDGSGLLTQINTKVNKTDASELSGGSLADARLSTNVPLKNTANTFTGVLTQNGLNLAGTAYNNQSFQNLLKNGNFESWSAGAVNVEPDAWGGFAGVTSARGHSLISYSGNYSYFETNVVGNGFSIYQSISPTPFLAKTLTYSVWVNSSTPNRAYIAISDGVGLYTSSRHSGSGNWELLTVTHQIDPGATHLWLYISDDGGTETTNYYDNAILVEGSTVPAFSESPLYNDSKTLYINENTNQVYAGKLTQESATKDWLCYDTSSGEILHYTGTCTVSDMNLKENISVINVTQNIINNFLNLSLLKYQEKNDINHIIRYGLNSTQLNQSFPMLVNLDKNNTPISIDYELISVLDMAIIQNKSTQITSLQNTINKICNRNQTLCS